MAVAVGLGVSQGVMVIMLKGTGLAGTGFLFALCLGYVLAITYVLSFSELCLMFKRAGTLSVYTEVALGQFPAIVAVLCGYVVVAMMETSAELVVLNVLLRDLFPAAVPPVCGRFRNADFFTVMTATLLVCGLVALFELSSTDPLDGAKS